MFKWKWSTKCASKHRSLNQWLSQSRFKIKFCEKSIHAHTHTHIHSLTHSHTQHRQIGKTWLTRYMDRSILRELCSWSSNLTNFSFWKCNTHDHELTQSGSTSCTFRKWKTVLWVPCGQHLQQTYMKHTYIKTRQTNTITDKQHPHSPSAYSGYTYPRKYSEGQKSKCTYMWPSLTKSVSSGILGILRCV